MAELAGALLAVAVVVVAALLMLRSWRGRRERDATLSSYPVPSPLGEPVLDVEALYVATTPEAEPIERLAVEGLAFRGAARVEVHPEGVLWRIAGEQPTFLPADRILAAGAATYAIDKGVEPDGLVVVTWIPEEREPGPAPVRVDSYLRARATGDAGRLIAAVNDIAAAPVAPRPDHEAGADPR